MAFSIGSLTGYYFEIVGKTTRLVASLMVLIGGAEGVLAAANIEVAAETDVTGVITEDTPMTTDDNTVTIVTKQTKKVQPTVGGKRTKPKPKAGLKAKSLNKKNANTLSFGDEGDE
jgi:hypothetical protein